MRPTDVLQLEHLAILRALDVLTAMADGLREGRTVSRRDIAELIAYLRGYADEVHHQKEELALFPALGRAGLPAQGGPVALMLREHALGRALVTELAELSTSLSGSPAERRAFCERASRYVDLLRAHVAKENQILFPIAERLLPRALKAELLQRFADLDRATTRSGERAGLERSLESLAQRYLTAAQAEAHGT